MSLALCLAINVLATNHTEIKLQTMEAKVLRFLEKAILVCFQAPETPIGT